MEKAHKQLNPPVKLKRTFNELYAQRISPYDKDIKAPMNIKTYYKALPYLRDAAHEDFFEKRIGRYINCLNTLMETRKLANDRLIFCILSVIYWDKLTMLHH